MYYLGSFMSASNPAYSSDKTIKKKHGALIFQLHSYRHFKARQCSFNYDPLMSRIKIIYSHIKRMCRNLLNSKRGVTGLDIGISFTTVKNFTSTTSQHYSFL